MSEPKIEEGTHSGALQELERHELLYAERQALKAGDMVAVLESLRHRHGVIHFALLGACVVQVALVVTRFVGSSEAGTSRVAWANILVLLCCSAMVAYEQSTIRRCNAALKSLEGERDAR